MSVKSVLIGIDPSFATAGVAIYEPATNNLILHGGDLFSCMSFLNNSGILGKAIAVIENPNLDGTVFGAWRRIAVEIERYNYGIIGTIIGIIESLKIGSGILSILRNRFPSIEKYRHSKTTIDDVRREFGIAMKHAQSVGKNKAAGELFIEIFERQGIPVLEIAPSSRHRADKDLLKYKNQGIKMLAMPTKTTAAQFEQYTGYSGRSNEHTRDAGTLVFHKTIQWAQTQIMIQQAKRK